MLEDWKKLPAYKLETRIDSMVGFALPHILESSLDLHSDLIIPELPIRLGTIHRKYANKPFADRSYKVDFYVRTKCGQNLFIEFKSDSGSRRVKQDDYLILSRKAKMKAILQGIIKISEVTSYKVKYAYLLNKLLKANLIENQKDKYKVIIGAEPIRIIYIQPKKLEGDTDKELILFPQIAEVIREGFPESWFMNRLASSLNNWKND